MICDGRGLPIAFRLVPGQAHELPQAGPLLAGLPRAPGWVVADKGYAAHTFRDADLGHGLQARHPGQKQRGSRRLPGLDLQQPAPRRERLGLASRSGESVATRYEKTATSFLGVLCLAAAVQWIKR